MEGTLRGMTFQAVPLSKPFGSVKRTCSSGRRMIFYEDGFYIPHKVAGEINWLREDNGNYILDVRNFPPQQLPWNEFMDFRRQP